MSAPVTERGRTAVRGRTAAIPAQRGYAAGAVGGAVATPAAAPTADPAAGRRSAQQKAYARREERAGRAAGARPTRTAAPAGRPQFVLLIMVLLAVGLVATLWLSTAAAADSYRLQDATAEARVLSEQVERLTQEVAVLASAPELARRAGELGMVPVRDPARLVVAANGSVDVVGQPRAAVAPPPPAPPAPPAPSGPERAAPGNTPPESTAPVEAAQDGTAQLAAPGSEEAGTAEVDGGEPGQDSTGNAAAQGPTGEDAAAGTGTRAGGDRTDAG